MTPSQHDPAQPGGIASPQALPGAGAGRSRRRLGIGLALAGAAAVTVGVAGVTIANAEPSGRSDVAASSPLFGGPGDRPGPGGFGGRHPGHLLVRGLFGPLHGEFVVPKPGGGFQTMATQHGEVTEISESSITLKSKDGFQKSYTVTGDTFVNSTRDGIDAVKKGAQAAVIAQVADGKATATRVIDLAKIKERREKLPERPDLPLPD